MHMYFLNGKLVIKYAKHRKKGIKLSIPFTGNKTQTMAKENHVRKVPHFS